MVLGTRQGSKASNNNNAIEIVITAKDNTQPVFGGISTALGKVSTQASVAAGKITVFAKSVKEASASGLEKIGTQTDKLGRSLQETGKIASDTYGIVEEALKGIYDLATFKADESTPSLFEQLQQQAKALLGDRSKLSTFFKDLKGTVTDVFTVEGERQQRRQQQQTRKILDSGSDIEIDRLYDEGIDRVYEQAGNERQRRRRQEQANQIRKRILAENPNLLSDDELDRLFQGNDSDRRLNDQELNQLRRRIFESNPDLLNNSDINELFQKTLDNRSNNQRNIDNAFQGLGTGRKINNLGLQAFQQQVAILQQGLQPTRLQSGILESTRKIGQVLSAEVIPSTINWSNIIDKIDNTIINSVSALKTVPEQINPYLDSVQKVSFGLAGTDETIETFGLLKEGISSTVGALNRIGQEIFFVQSAFFALQQLVNNGPFALLIKQNIELRAQLLSTQAAIASTSRIFDQFTRQQIKDPVIAIQALAPAVRQTFERIRQDSLELVGVTSAELVDLFQIISTQAGQAGASLGDVQQLVSSFAGSLTLVGVPLYQARQEINSILTMTVDQNSVLAKTLGINNQMLRTWFAQGKLVDKLLDKLKVFREANALAAKSVEGVWSNIQDAIEVIGQYAGENLIDPIVAQLNKVYEFLTEIDKLGNRIVKTTIKKSVRELAELLFEGVEDFVNGVEQLLKVLSTSLAAVPSFLVRGLSLALEALGDSLITLSAVLRPFVALFGELAKLTSSIILPIVKLGLTVTLIKGAIAILSRATSILLRALPIVGEGLFLITLRLNPILNLFGLLSPLIGRGAAGFLLLGKNMATLPPIAAKTSQAMIGGLFEKMGKSIPGNVGKAVGSLKIFSGMLNNLVPGLSSVLEQVVLFSNAFPPLKKQLDKLLGLRPTQFFAGLEQQFKRFQNVKLGLPQFNFDQVNNLPIRNLLKDIDAAVFDKFRTSIGKVFPFLDQFVKGANKASAATQALNANMTLGTLLTKQFALTIKKAAITLATSVAKMAGQFLLIYAAFELINRLVLQNKGLLEYLSYLVEAIASLGDVLGILDNFIDLLKQIPPIITTLTLALAGLMGVQLVRWLLLSGKAAATATVGFNFLSVGIKAFVLNIRVASASLVLFLRQWLLTQAKMLSSIGFTVAAAQVYKLTTALRVLVFTLKSGKIVATFQALLTVLIASLPVLALVAAAVVLLGGVFIGFHRSATMAKEAMQASLKIIAEEADMRIRKLKLLAAAIEEVRAKQQKQAQEGIVLTKEQIKENARLIKSMKTQKSLLDQQIGDIETQLDPKKAKKALNKEKEEVARVQKLSQEQRKKEKNDLDKQIKQTEKDLESIGDSSPATTALFEERLKELKEKRKLLTMSLAELGAEIQKYESKIKNLPSKAKGEVKKELEKTLEELKEARDEVVSILGSGLQTKPLDIEVRGSIFQQLSDEYNQFKTQLEKGEGDDSTFQAGVGRLITLTELAREYNIITYENAREQLEAIASNEKVLRENQIKAIQALGQLTQQESQRRIAILKQEAEEYKTLSQIGRLTDVQAAEAVNRNKLQQLDAEITLIQQQIADRQKVLSIAKEDVAENKTIIQQEQDKLKELEKQKAAKEKEAKLTFSGDRLNKELTNIDEKHKKQQEEIKDNIKTAQSKIGALQNAVNAANDPELARLAQEYDNLTAQRIESELEIDKLKSDLITKQAKEAASVNEAVIEAAIVTGQLSKTDAAIAQGEEQLKAIETNIEQVARQYENRIKVLREKLGDDYNQDNDNRLKELGNTLKIVKAERDKLKVQNELKVIELQINSAKQKELNILNETVLKLQQEVRLRERIAKIVEIQQSVLSGQLNAIKSTSSLLETQLGVIRDAQPTERKRKQVEEVIANIKLKILLKEQAIARETFEFERRKLELSIQREQAENRIAQSQSVVGVTEAKAEIAKAAADPSTSQGTLKALVLKLAAAEEQLAATIQQGEILQEQAPIQFRLKDLEGRSLLDQQRGERIQAAKGIVDTLPKGQQRRATKALADIFSQEVFGTGFKNVGRQGRSLTIENLEGLGINITKALKDSRLLEFAPYLEDLRDGLSPSAFEGAVRNAQTDMKDYYGDAMKTISEPLQTFLGQTSAFLTNINNKLDETNNLFRSLLTGTELPVIAQSVTAIASNTEPSNNKPEPASQETEKEDRVISKTPSLDRLKDNITRPEPKTKPQDPPKTEPYIYFETPDGEKRLYTKGKGLYSNQEQPETIDNEKAKLYDKRNSYGAIASPVAPQSGFIEQSVLNKLSELIAVTGNTSTRNDISISFYKQVEGSTTTKVSGSISQSKPDIQEVINALQNL